VDTEAVRQLGDSDSLAKQKISKCAFGPVLSAQHQLLTDAQLIRLLCEGRPFARPTAETASDVLNAIEFDRHDSAARMRAILCASIFFAWRIHSATPAGG
jgi:hypothetical protein